MTAYNNAVNLPIVATIFHYKRSLNNPSVIDMEHIEVEGSGT